MNRNYDATSELGTFVTKLLITIVAVIVLFSVIVIFVLPVVVENYENTDVQTGSAIDGNAAQKIIDYLDKEPIIPDAAADGILIAESQIGETSLTGAYVSDGIFYFTVELTNGADSELNLADYGVVTAGEPEISVPFAVDYGSEAIDIPAGETAALTFVFGAADIIRGSRWIPTRFMFNLVSGDKSVTYPLSVTIAWLYDSYE
ncbi:MAG: hypothetical protein LBN43_04735 [Oscillospiraceae bacterium]|jgi:hypothetical protein|nr:hypothetical protein [Oscillospiraceae bacterium]